MLTIGAHSHSHPNLKQQTSESAYNEIKKSKDLLEGQLGHSVDHFAYPFGTANDAGNREYNLASSCGFSTAATAIPVTLCSQMLFSIPRLGMPPFLTLQGFKGKVSGLEHIGRMVVHFLKKILLLRMN